MTLETLLHLPRFAAFLLAEKQEAFVKKSFEEAAALNVPMLRFFLDMPEEQRHEVGLAAVRELLEALAANNGAEQIRLSQQQWQTNQLPVVNRDAIAAEDINLVNYLRKKVMLDFVPDYTQDPQEIVALVKEIDFFVMQSITAATNTYISLYKERLEDNTHFLQKVIETVPGAVYVFDVENYKGVYSNNKLAGIIGYDQAALNALGPSAIASLVHPDDQPNLRRHLDEIKRSSDRGTAFFKYRIRKKDGGYKWLANHESVFKRKENGAVWQTIGITLDVDKEQRTIDALNKREQQLSEAQTIAQMGDFYWDFAGEASFASPKTTELLELAPNATNFWKSLHQSDEEKFQSALNKAKETGQFNCECRVQGQSGVRNIWARGVLDFKDGKAAGMTGTVMDVSEHNQLLQKLSEADNRHKQAEALAHIGTYAWNFVTGVVDWSDEMHRIYETTPDDTIDYGFIRRWINPDDLAKIDEAIGLSIQHQQAFDFHYRLTTRNGNVKILHSRGRVEADADGKPHRIVGTDQDVTEKQTLIQQLQKTEALYKQAEEIADMGNWSWDVATKKLAWTDQLYRIYGLEPQSEDVTMERFLSFVHPDDREYVSQGVDKLTANDTLDYTFRIVTPDGAEKWLRSIAHVLRNESGAATAVIGTEQNVTEKQKLIGKLEESQRLYKQAQELARMGNFLWNLQTNQVFWSDEVYRIYEKPYGESVSFDDAFLPIVEEHKPLVQKAIHETVSAKAGQSVSYAIQTKNGKRTYVNLHTDVQLAKDGTVTAIIGTAQDVSEKEELINRLRESQTLIRKITDATPSIIASYNVNTGRYTFVSEGVEKLLGYTPAEAMEKGTALFNDIIHPDDAPALQEKNAKALAEANGAADKKDLVMEFTYRLRHRDGRYRWFHTYGTAFDYNAEGSVEHILNITLDVTEQKEAVETIQEQEYFIQQIADASPTILYLFDVPSQSVAYINREAFFVLGYLPEEIVEEGDNVTGLLYHPDDLPLLPGRRQSRKNFKQVDSMIQYECRMKHKDGDYRWLLVREIVFKSNEDGNVTQIIGAALDISRRKEMERTILQNAHQLEQSNASLEEFAYVASHDLKEPLRKISTFGDRLVATQLDKLSDEGKIYLRKIVDASQRMQNMISDLLSISMISGNRQFEPWSLQKILEETLQTLEFKIEQQKAIIRYDGLPLAHVIPSQFRQLFQNLIANSLKFVRDGVQPVIVISCSAVTEEELSLYQLNKSRPYLKLVFSDNGIGFENEYAQKIFAIFQRLHGRSEYEGSGIGLAICKKIVEHHGGVIFANGRPDAGATFTLILPA